MQRGSHFNAHTNGHVGPDFADDPDNFSQNERLREIFQTRMEVHQTRINIRKAIALGRATTESALSVYASAVVGYLMELEPLMTAQYEDKGREYWEEIELGEVYSPTPKSMPDGEVYGTQLRNVEEPDPVTITGLGELVEIDDTVQFTWRYEYCDPRKGWTEEVATASVPVPLGVLDKAYREANRFIADIGMDLEPNADLDAGPL